MIMKNFTISIPIWLGLALAIIFPYYGMKLSGAGFSILFGLCFWNLFFFDFKSSLKASNLSWDLCFYMLIGYVLFPALQMLIIRPLIDDHSLRLGYMLAAISPVAVICPQFLSEDKRDKAIIYILLSTLLYPIICYFFISALKFENLGIKIIPIIKDTLILTMLPLVLAIVTQLLMPAFKSRIKAATKNYNSLINMCLIGSLVFIYFGASFAKTNYASINGLTIFILVALALLQDFGAYGLMKMLKFPETEVVCFSIKNVALSGGVLLIFHPQGVLSCSLVFMAHALFFTFLTFKRGCKEQRD